MKTKKSSRSPLVEKRINSVGSALLHLRLSLMPAFAALSEYTRSPSRYAARRVTLRHRELVRRARAVRRSAQAVCRALERL